MKSLRLTPFLILAACAAPKATVVDEPKKNKASTPVLVQEPVMPKDDEAEQLRLPSDLLGKLPDSNQFQATNPNLPKANSNDGAAVIAKPPAEAPR